MSVLTPYFRCTGGWFKPQSRNLSRMNGSSWRTTTGSMGQKACVCVERFCNFILLFSMFALDNQISKHLFEPKWTFYTNWFISGFRAVSFTLQTQDLLGTVVNILKSCCLSIDHIQDSKAAVDSPHQNGSISFSRPIKWDKTYYTFTGYRDPEEELDSSRQLEPILGYERLILYYGSWVVQMNVRNREVRCNSSS